MSLEWEQTVVDARDPAGLGRWWQAALGWVSVATDPGDESWVVLADPEGNEFCVLRSRGSDR